MTQDINNLMLTVKRGGAFVSVPNLELARGIEYSTQYPGGLYADAAFFLPGDTRFPCSLAPLDFVQIWCGLELAWEGDVMTLEAAAAQGETGWRVACLGWWATHLMARKVAKPWADTRMEENVWPTWPTGANARMEKFDLDREDRIRCTPKDGIAIAQYDTAWYAQYEPPVGQTIKRITFDYDVQMAAQSWAAGLRDITANANAWVVFVSGSGSVDYTFPTPSARVVFWMQAQAALTGIGDGTVYAQVSNLAVYTETGAINAQEITKDCAVYGGFSGDLSAIGALTDSLVPFIALPAKSLAEVLTDATQYGSAAFVAWAVYVDKSPNASTGIPRLALQPFVATTSHNFNLQMDAPNVDAGVRFAKDVSEVINSYFLSYTDVRGIEKYVSSSNDAGLKDDTSIALNGLRQSENIAVNTTDLALVKQYGKTKLAQTKDLRWKASGDIVVTGWLEHSSGSIVPAALVDSGKVLRVLNYLTDMTTSNLSLLITGTRYTHDDRKVSISTGWPDTTEAWLARQLRGKV